MARIRSLKPEFWDDRKLARSTSRDARMLYMGLWNQADEHSRLNGDVVWIKGRVFPYDEDLTDDAVEALLCELANAGRITRYEHDGDPFIFIPKLGKHQRLEPAKVDSRLPEPPADPDAISSEPRADKSARNAKPSALLYGAGSMEHGAGDARDELAPTPPQTTCKRQHPADENCRDCKVDRITREKWDAAKPERDRRLKAARLKAIGDCDECDPDGWLYTPSGDVTSKKHDHPLSDHRRQAS